MQDASPERKANSVGLLRLLLAGSVIVGHAPELIDGSRVREPLTRVFGTVSLGEVAVDGFFLLSGFLITGSMLSPGMTLGRFVRRRVLRIVPGYVVAFVLSVFAMGPVVGVDVWGELPRVLVRLLLLAPPPDSPDIFADAHVQSLNGSMWTLAYELRCYMLVGVMGVAGLLARRGVVLGLTVGVLAASVAVHHPGVAWRLRHLKLHELHLVAGSAEDNARLVGAFLVGCCARLYRNEFGRVAGRPVAVGVIVGAATLLLVPLLFLHGVAEVACIVLGAVPLFWLALHARLGWFGRVNSRVDISYGVYLYGWPIALFIVWLHPDISPGALAAWTLGLAVPFGLASWHGVERWFKADGGADGGAGGRSGQRDRAGSGGGRAVGGGSWFETGERG